MKKNSNSIAKRNARTILNRDWTGPVLVALLLFTLTLLAAAVMIPFATAKTNHTWNLICGAGVEFILLLLLRLFYYGADDYFLKDIRKADPAYADLLYPFRHQPDRFLLVGLVQLGIPALCALPILGFAELYRSGFRAAILLLIIWCVAAVILIVILELSFAMAPCLLLDNQQMNAGQALRASRKLMKHRKGKLFRLLLSFLPWVLLALCTFGIGELWILPYFMTSEICFYEQLVYPAELPEV
jgi:uncharacterized membrane protein